MFDFSPAGLLGSLLFSVIGMLAFGYGKKHTDVPKLVLGAVLMVYPYVVDNLWLLYGIGIGLTALLFVWKDDG